MLPRGPRAGCCHGDRGCFSPLKAAWRKYFHEFGARNPGKVVTRYDFCEIFSRAWFSAMTGQNVISSFRATGVCPFNRHVFDEATAESVVPLKQPNLAEKTGLAYIPLFSPFVPRRDQNPSMTSTPCSSSTLQRSQSLSDLDVSYTSKSPFSTQKSFDDSSYLKSNIPLRRTTSLSKFLLPPPHPNQAVTKHGKSSGCVLTSQENLLMLAEKEQRKLEVRRKRLEELGLGRYLCMNRIVEG